MSTTEKELREHLEEKRAVVEYLENVKGLFVEVGTNDPGEGSQTYLLEKEKGWRGILVEPNDDFSTAYKESRPNSLHANVACTSPDKVGELVLYIPASTGMASTEKHIDDHELNYEKEHRVRAITFEDIISESGLDDEVAFVSIDVEGTELDVLKGINFEIRKPQLILMEDKLQTLDKHRFLKSNGYRLVKRTCMNNWYIPADNPLPVRSWAEPFLLFRKVFLSYPFRRLKRWRKTGK